MKMWRTLLFWVITGRHPLRLKDELRTGWHAYFRRSIWHAARVLTIVSAGFSSWLTARRSPELRAEVVKATLSAAAFRNTQPGVKYVGSAACAPCHLDICKTFQKTDMGRSMSLASN